MEQKKNKLHEDWVRLTKKLLKEDIQEVGNDGSEEEVSGDFKSEIANLQHLLEFLDKTCNVTTSAVFGSTLGNLIKNDQAGLEDLVRKVKKLEDGAYTIQTMYHKIDDMLSGISDSDTATPEQKAEADKYIKVAYDIYKQSVAIDKKITALLNFVNKLSHVLEFEMKEEDSDMIKKLAK